jgi:hypothetical protein
MPSLKSHGTYNRATNRTNQYDMSTFYHSSKFNLPSITNTGLI